MTFLCFDCPCFVTIGGLAMLCGFVLTILGYYMPAFGPFYDFVMLAEVIGPLLLIGGCIFIFWPCIRCLLPRCDCFKNWWLRFKAFFCAACCKNGCTVRFPPKCCVGSVRPAASGEILTSGPPSGEGEPGTGTGCFGKVRSPQQWYQELPKPVWMAQKPQWMQNGLQKPQWADKIKKPQWTAIKMKKPEWAQNGINKPEWVKNGIKKPQWVENGIKKPQWVENYKRPQWIENNMHRPQWMETGVQRFLVWFRVIKRKSPFTGLIHNGRVGIEPTMV